MTNCNHIEEHIISVLKNDLPKSLTYHNADHTVDVVLQCMTIAKDEGITNERTLIELKLAALYHDTGFLKTYFGHEEKSCEIARQDLSLFKINPAIIDNVCQIIIATKMPQSPKNMQQQIICDADLDYLGSNNYFGINEMLQKEFIFFGIITNEEEWKASRINFLQRHVYFTQSQQKRRDMMKQAHLQGLLNEKVVRMQIEPNLSNDHIPVN